jgi:hypothetical protein
MTPSHTAVHFCIAIRIRVKGYTDCIDCTVSIHNLAIYKVGFWGLYSTLYMGFVARE